MCGIVGVVSFVGTADNVERVRQGVQSIAHRGPDARHIWSAQPVTLGHARLSIIDLSPAANQPMLDGTGRYAIVFNGEVYNFRELRDELERRGSIFRTSSDTEVVLESYKAWGLDAFARMRGMYALAVWDSHEQSLTLARDPLGIKPLFYRQDSTSIEFGSEIKALLAMQAGQWSIDCSAMHEYLWFGNVLGQRTAYDEIRRLEAGTCLKFDQRGTQLKRIWDIRRVRPTSDTFPTATERVRALLGSAVRSHLISDVPVGVMLSGGIDSSAIATFAARSSRLSTYSVAFDFEDTGELPLAARLARELGAEHHELFVKTSELTSLVEKLVDSHDEPFADAANIPLYLATRELDSGIKVLLQGDGGDEMFAGYRRYAWLARRGPWRALRKLTTTLIPPDARLPDTALRALRMIEALGAPDHLRYALLLTVDSERHLPEQIAGSELMSRLRASDPFARYQEMSHQFRGLDDVQRMLWIDTSILLPDTFLEKVDRSTMANGIEVRVPFLDLDLAEYAMSLPSHFKVQGGERKRVLRAALRGIVPDEVLDRRKRGFGVPYGQWVKQPLYALMHSLAHDSRAVRDGLLNGERMNTLLEEHRSGVRNHGFLLWKGLQLATWYERYPVTL